MDDHIFNIAEAKMHLSRLIERVERGERITIARNNRPIAVISPLRASAQDRLLELDALRDRIFARTGGKPVLRPGERWRDLVAAGRRT